MIDYLVLALIALVAGCAGGILWMKSKYSATIAQIDSQQKETERLSSELGQQVAKNEQTDKALRDALQQCSSLEARLQAADTMADNERLAAEAKLKDTKAEAAARLEEVKGEAAKTLKELKEAHEKQLEDKDTAHKTAMHDLETRFNEVVDKVSAQLKSASDEMLKERQKEFATSSQTSLNQILTPLRENITQMKKAMDDNTLTQTSMSGVMKHQMETMIQQTRETKESADELTRVFKHQSKVQGDWGETVLTELLQSQGLTEGIHFTTQTVMRDASGDTVHTDTGSIMRPDVIVHLDMRRDLIIDAKVSLTDFISYVNAENDVQRELFLKKHIDSLMRHVDELSRKDYSSYVKPPHLRMDYVIMFVPHSAALWTAMNRQPDLWRRAMEKNVFIADEQTLYAALRIINLTWTQINQAQNHAEVYRLANEMLNRVGLFVDFYGKIGKGLKSACEAYESGRRKISEGGQSITNTSHKLVALGAKQNDKNRIFDMTDVDNIQPLPLPDLSDVSPTLPSGESEETDLT